MKIEVKFEGLTASIETEDAAALFRIINALKKDGRNPEIKREKENWQILNAA